MMSRRHVKTTHAIMGTVNAKLIHLAINDRIRCVDTESLRQNAGPSSQFRRSQIGIRNPYETLHDHLARHSFRRLELETPERVRNQE